MRKPIYDRVATLTEAFHSNQEVAIATATMTTTVTALA